MQCCQDLHQPCSVILLQLVVLSRDVVLCHPLPNGRVGGPAASTDKRGFTSLLPHFLSSSPPIPSPPSPPPLPSPPSPPHPDSPAAEADLVPSQVDVLVWEDPRQLLEETLKEHPVVRIGRVNRSIAVTHRRKRRAADDAELHNTPPHSIREPDLMHQYLPLQLPPPPNSLPSPNSWCSFKYEHDTPNRKSNAKCDHEQIKSIYCLEELGGGSPMWEGVSHVGGGLPCGRAGAQCTLLIPPLSLHHIGT